MARKPTAMRTVKNTAKKATQTLPAERKLVDTDTGKGHSRRDAGGELQKSADVRRSLGSHKRRKTKRRVTEEEEQEGPDED